MICCQQINPEMVDTSVCVPKKPNACMHEFRIANIIKSTFTFAFGLCSCILWIHVNNQLCFGKIRVSVEIGMR